MSQLVRLSVDRTLRLLGDPERPDVETLAALRREAAGAPETSGHD
jgi:hypothetical protein